MGVDSQIINELDDMFFSIVEFPIVLSKYGTHITSWVNRFCQQMLLGVPVAEVSSTVASYHCLVFKPADTLTLEAYSDADWACNLDDRKSTIGFCVMLRGNLVTRASRKQTAVACSSTESEYRSLSTTATKVV
ncbi:uncharacterized mitochondrial protein AtMg00810-like [Cannabis sativa]|uniref:uncharacterized mitochondrial protein AtMg00810-like n=1 Tax=Cannabis sativa TaxID=3483 RepID=UPI0029CA61D6|nr:uncharacterized mitochondrial protein AtMg00810-like [Cannabis sativa]